VCWRVFRLECAIVREERAEEEGAVCCNVLQCVAICCSVLQCVAVCWRVPYVAVCCSVLQCVGVCCAYSVTLVEMNERKRRLQCVAMYCSVLQYVAVCCSVLQCDEVQKFDKQNRNNFIKFQSRLRLWVGYD